jgi:exopolyphosphatase/guanosine-5'-triphosphate,3'-diphosphate pyrophosphatase
MDTAPKTVAVIDIGSTAIRMVIAELLPNGEWRIVDRLGKPVPFGRDVFVGESITRETMLQALQVLNGFRELLAGWHIGVQDVQVIATNAIREAKNRDTFVDRVALRTGFRIRVLEGIDQNHLTFLAVEHTLKGVRPNPLRNNSLIMEVGGGSTELMLLQRGKMAAAHSLRLGTVRVDQQVRLSPGSSGYLWSYLSENIKTMQEFLDDELKLSKITTFVAVGGDARLAAQQAGVKKDERYSVIQKSAFDGLVARIKDFSVEDCVREFRIPYHDAEGLVPALYIFKHFMDATTAVRMIVPNVSIREGVLISLTMGPDPVMREGFLSQVIASAMSLGRKYRFDELHARHVADLSLALFDALQNEHGLDRHARLLLEVAALLHDIGTYVSANGHHKHGQYLVANSDVFGLQKNDMELVSNVVRYHRRSPPVSSHITFISLPLEDRMLVQKLSAILRVADGMDRGHIQRIRSFTAEKSPDELVLRCVTIGDISAERLGVEEKSDMFEEVFGMRVVLE